MFAPTVALVRQHYKELKEYFCTREYQAAHRYVKLDYLVGPEKELKPPVEIMLKYHHVSCCQYGCVTNTKLYVRNILGMASVCLSSIPLSLVKYEQTFYIPGYGDDTSNVLHGTEEWSVGGCLPSHSHGV